MDISSMTLEIAKPRLDALELLEEFSYACRDRGLTEETIGRYKSPLKLFIEFIGKKGLALTDVDKFVLKDFISYRRVQGVEQKTLENNLTALSSFYEFLCFEGHTNVNPVLPVRKRYLKRYKDDGDSNDSERKLISIEEMSMLVNSILSVRDRAVVTLLAKTGIRRNELVSIDVQDIDWTEQSITLKKKRFKKRSNRIVFFDDECARILRRCMAQREKLNVKAEALFTNEYGTRLNRNGVYNLVTKYAEALSLHNPESDRIEDHFSPHNCRHWFTTWLRRNGMPREFIQVLRGDKRRDAIDIYDHIDNEELRKAYLAFVPQLGIE